ncbi:hypothetical protein [Streptomyces sp. MZ04]|uniref:hypothetical protein n=1 Tax=Streptomyces sp. MZ04 TaxID=2559236 RepID=UPI0014330A45|nr:hypothetical protein [Streptomyces sp. MZ04]
MAGVLLGLSVAAVRLLVIVVLIRDDGLESRHDRVRELLGQLATDATRGRFVARA